MSRSQLGMHKRAALLLVYCVAVSDGILQAEYESDTPCAQQGSRTASTIITLRCAAAAAPPTLLYTSVHCHYMFDWYTPVACLTPDR